MLKMKKYNNLVEEISIEEKTNVMLFTLDYLCGWTSELGGLWICFSFIDERGLDRSLLFWEAKLLIKLLAFITFKIVEIIIMIIISELGYPERCHSQIGLFLKSLY